MARDRLLPARFSVALVARTHLQPGPLIGRAFASARERTQVLCARMPRERRWKVPNQAAADYVATAAELLWHSLALCAFRPRSSSSPTLPQHAPGRQVFGCSSPAFNNSKKDSVGHRRPRGCGRKFLDAHSAQRSWMGPASAVMHIAR